MAFPVIRLWVKTVLGSHFGVGAPFLEPISAGIESDVHWGLTGILTHGQKGVVRFWGRSF